MKSIINNKAQDITCLVIFGVVIIILIILLATGFSTKKVNIDVNSNVEPFISSLKKMFSDDTNVEPVIDGEIQNEATIRESKAPFPPNKLDEIRDVPPPTKKITPTIKNPDNNYSISDLNKHFKPKTTSNVPVDITSVQNNENKSIKHQTIESNPDGMLKPEIKGKTDNIPVINSNGGKVGPHSLKPSTDLYNIIGSDSFKFFDANFVPDAKQYVYTGAEIGVESDVPINFKCHGGKDEVQAEAVAKINEEGEVSEIIMLHKGSGYKKAKVKVEGGGGKGCRAKAIVDDDSKISHIEIENGGKHYASTPQIIISKPSQNKTCKLFFKKQQK